MEFKRAFIATLLTVAGSFLSLPQGAWASAVITPGDLATAVAERESKVPEFKFIRAEAERLGLRVWLFGGTAAGFIHYVKWDLQREKGDARYQGDRFDYDYTNIYRSTQDLDIVIDGNENQKYKFQEILQTKYPEFLGSKNKWEVRLLTQPTGHKGVLGYKEALLADYDFANQDTDSNSTGMIELTRKSGDAVVRDLREWHQEGNNSFLRDSAAGRNTFYRSQNHYKTSRASLGKNPEIVSVIRALTKAFQYELTFSENDQAEMQDIVNQFDPNLIKDGEALWRITDNGKKLFKHAVNLEYAWNTLEKMGLRKKLLQFGGKETEDTLGWWMNKEPLRTYAVGTGSGRTARDLGISMVAHETNSFLSYESITRAHTGDPNVFISRQDAAGEQAVYGKGFYTRRGREGARQTKITIRFLMNPEAREGSDFTLHDDFVLLQNKAAMSVIPESLNMSLLEYLQFVFEGKDVASGDKGIYEKMRRRLSMQVNHLSAGDEHAIKKLVDAALAPGASQPSKAVLFELLKFPGSERFLNIKDSRVLSALQDPMMLASFFQSPLTQAYPELLVPLIMKGNIMGVVRRENQFIIQPLEVAFSSPWKDSPEVIDAVVQKFLKKEASSTDETPEGDYRISLRHKLLMNPDVVLSKLHRMESAQDRQKLLLMLIDEAYAPEEKSNLALILRSGRAEELTPEIMSAAGNKGIAEVTKDFVHRVLTNPGPGNILMSKFLDGRWIALTVQQELFNAFVTDPYWKQQPEMMRKLVQRGTLDSNLLSGYLRTPEGLKRRDLLAIIIKKGVVMGAIDRYLEDIYAKDPEFMDMAEKAGWFASKVTAANIKKAMDKGYSLPGTEGLRCEALLQ